MNKRVYVVQSTYRVTGTATVVASSAAEAARIGREGYPDGYRPIFDFSEPHSETRMRAFRADEDSYVSEAVNDNGFSRTPVVESSTEPARGCQCRPGRWCGCPETTPDPEW